MNEMLKKFSEQLKKKREEKKISIDQIHSKTRIDKKFIEAIEEGNFSIMPEFYMKAFLREYCGAVNLNTDEIVSKFELAKQGLNFEPSETNENANDENEKTKESKLPKKKNVKTPEIIKDVNPPSIENFKQPQVSKHIEKNYPVYYSLLAIVLMLIIFVVYNTFLRDKENSFITEKPFEETLPQKVVIDTLSSDTSFVKTDSLNSTIKDTVNQIDEEILNSQIVQPQKNGLELKIVCDDKAWIRAVIDEKDNNEFTITSGMTRVFNAQEQFLLHIGNSGSVKLFLNSKELAFNKAVGRARKLIITKNGIEYLSLKKAVTNE
ncbi:MAG: helix-turn-helix domain-containing protein [Ignavibacteriae bacterium]|nr:helix-turn-helix domain-containing protein [Ignavibacteriota bacterium]